MKPLLLAFVALLVPSSAVLNAADHLTTPWTEEAAAGRGWNEYPRPALVRADWMNLNGWWDYQIAAGSGLVPAAFAGKIRVPYAPESVLSGVQRSVMPGERLWYRRQFEVPADWKGKRILLHFGGVNWETTVLLNGAVVGSHRGAFDPFSFDLTGQLREGGPQELVLCVSNPSSEGEQPRGKQRLDQSGIWYTPDSGIWQTVWLEPVAAENAIAEVRLTPDVDGQRVTIAVFGTKPMRPELYGVRAQVFDAGRLARRGVRPGRPAI